MATNDVNLQVINSMTQEQMQSLKDSSGKIPSLANQLIMTDEEDVNLSQLRTKVLWENPNPTVSFNTSTTISLGSENYSYLLIEYMAYPTIYASMIVPFKEGEGSIYYSYSDTSTSNSTYFVQLGQRKFTINSSNQITFGDGYWVNHSEKLLLNNYMIPTKITGILKTPAMIYTGEELHEGNGISIVNGVVSAESNLFFYGAVGTASSTYTITKDFTDGIYDIILIGTTSKGLDLFVMPNNNNKTVYGNAWMNYANTAPTGSEASTTGFNVGTAGTNYSIFHMTMTVADGIVIMESSSICNFSGTTYRRNNVRYGDGYGNVKSLVFSTNGAGDMNTGFKFKVYRRSYD